MVGRQEDGAGRAGGNGVEGSPIPAVCEPAAVRELERKGEREMNGGTNGVGGVKGTKLSQEFHVKTNDSVLREGRGRGKEGAIGKGA